VQMTEIELLQSFLTHSYAWRNLDKHDHRIFSKWDTC